MPRAEEKTAALIPATPLMGVAMKNKLGAGEAESRMRVVDEQTGQSFIFAENGGRDAGCVHLRALQARNPQDRQKPGVDAVHVPVIIAQVDQLFRPGNPGCAYCLSQQTAVPMGIGKKREQVHAGA
jgi:hypothetical protein